MAAAAVRPDIDPKATSLPALIRWSTNRYADLPAVTDGDVTLSYRELGDDVDRCAAALIERGIEPGDAVAVWAPNSWRWLVVGLAVSRAGAVLVPINTRFKGAEAAYVLERTSARVLFVSDGFLDFDYSNSLADHDLPALELVVNLAEDRAFADFQAGGNLAAYQDEIERRTDAMAPDDVGVIMFTSGTTGNPKGVLIRGGAIIRAFHDYGQVLTVQEGDPYLLVNPYFHAFGYNSGVIVCLLFGALNLPVPVYDEQAVLRLIERERVAVFPGPPAVFQGLLNAPDLGDYDISSLRACVTGAATIPVEMIIGMRDRLGFETIVTAYGMTETSGIAAYTRAGDPPELIASTSGCAIDGGELRVVDDGGNDVAAGTPGELLVRGFQVTPGYLDDPIQTAEAIDADGWLHTGDIAVMDEGGYIDITDRKKDMFIIGGFNAYPAEIERMMLEHRHIGMVSVIGVPDDRMGEVGAAYVVPSPNATPDPDALTAWCRETMANYKVPRHIWIVDELPMTASNKVRKPELRALAAERLATREGSTP